MLCKVLNKSYYYISPTIITNLIERNLKPNILYPTKNDLKTEF
jgi:hypothetical protein